MSAILDFPRDLIAHIGALADIQVRNAWRLSHRCFAGAHEDRTTHDLTFVGSEQAAQVKQRLEACLRLKPRLNDLWITFKGIEEADVDLSLVQQVETVLIDIQGCGAGFRISGLTGKRVKVRLPTSASPSPDLVQFLRDQSDVKMEMGAVHGALLLDHELMRKVSVLCLITNPLDKGALLDFSLAEAVPDVLLEVNCDNLTVAGANAITSLRFNFDDALNYNMELWRLRAWLSTLSLEGGCRLASVDCSNIFWPSTLAGLQGPNFFPKYLVDLVGRAAPMAEVALHAGHPAALQFVRSCTPPNARLAFLAGGDNDWYVCARLAQVLLSSATGRHVPIRMNASYNTPEVLRGLTTVSELYGALQNDCFRSAWYMAEYWPTVV